MLARPPDGLIERASHVASFRGLEEAIDLLVDDIVLNSILIIKLNLSVLPSNGRKRLTKPFLLLRPTDQIIHCHNQSSKSMVTTVNTA